MGGFSSESDISLKSGSVVMEHLNGDHFHTHKVVISQNEWTYQSRDGKLFVVDKNDNMIAFAITMPSFSKALQKAKGKLLPFGVFHLLKAKKNNKFSLIWIEEFRKGEKIPTIDAVKLEPSANAAKQPNKISKALMTKSL